MSSSKLYRVVVAGGGSAGLTLAIRMGRLLGAQNVALIEPKDEHYYQPLWTLVGAGYKTFEQSSKPMKKFIPKNMHWEKQSIVRFQPDQNEVVLKNGDKLQYDYLIVALGVNGDYKKIPGVYEGMQNASNVCSNYHPHYVTKTIKAINGVKEGLALFTHPNTPVKCPGASQKIMYLAEEIVRERGERDKVDFAFATPGAAIFGVERYAETLRYVADSRGIKVLLKHNLVELDWKNNVATFDKVTQSNGSEPKTEKVQLPYGMIHVTPPFKPPEVISTNQSLAAPNTGYLDININTLQHLKYNNIFGIGDNINIASSKTAAGIAAQSGILENNLKKVMEKKLPVRFYDGYTSCPLVTGKRKGLIAEFDINGEPLETFPSIFSQHKEGFAWFHLKSSLMPILYWHLFIRGPWKGPAVFRKIFHLGFGR